MKKVYNPRFQSVWTCVLGRNQSGKTDFALHQLEHLHKLGLADGFGANIPDLEADFDIDFIEDFQTLKRRCQMLNPNPKTKGLKRYFFLADEMGNWAPQDQPWLNVNLVRELQSVRKYGLSVIGTAIDRVDGRILNEKHFHGYFMKASKANPTVGYYFDWLNYGRTTLLNIPRTKIEFDTFHSATFYMEPQTPTDRLLPLNPEHKMVIKYLDNGESWRGTGVHRQTGKNALGKVLRYHLKNCLNNLPEQGEESLPTQEPEIAKEKEVTAS